MRADTLRQRATLVLVSGLLILMTAAWSAAAGAESVLYGPVLPASAGSDLGLAFSNPTLSPASVTLVARSYDGTLIAVNGVSNPATIALPASGQRAFRAAEIFGDAIAGQAGWIEARASNPAIKGFFLLFDAGLTFVEGSEFQSRPASRIIFQKVIARAAGKSSALHFVNTTATSIAAAAVSLYDDSGRLVSRRLLPLAPYAGFSGSVAELFPSVVDFRGYAVVETTSTPFSAPVDALIGFESHTDRADAAGLNASSEAAMQRTGYLPHLVSRGGYRTDLTLVNYSSQPQTVRITASGLQSGGVASQPSTLAVVRTLPPFGRLEEAADDLFGLRGPDLVAGYIQWEVQGDTRGLIGSVDYGTSDGMLLSAAAAPASAYSDFYFSHLAEGAGYYTGLALLNPNANAAAANVQIFDRDGSLVGAGGLTLAGGEKRALLLHEIVPAAAGQLGGYVRVTASRPLFAVELFGSAGLTFLANVPGEGAALEPQAGGRTVTAAEGATVLSGSQLISIAIPPGALSQDTAVSIDVPATPLPPLSSSDRIVAAIEGRPAGLQFNIPVPLKLPLAVQLEPGSALDLHLFDAATGSYRPAGKATVDDSGRAATALLSHFSIYALSVPADRFLAVETLSPSSGRAGATVTIGGSGFGATPGDYEVMFAGPDNTAVRGAVTAAAATALTVTVPEGAISGNVIVKSGGRTSLGRWFSVMDERPKPVLSAITPTTFNPDAASLEFRAAGTGFQQDSVVQVDGSGVATSFADATLLLATVAGAGVAPGEHRVTIFTPGAGGGVSADSKAYMVGYPVPRIAGITPSAAERSSSVAVTITGAGFTPSSIVRLEGVVAPSTFVSGTCIIAYIESAAAKDALLTVANPAPLGGDSNSVVFSFVEAVVRSMSLITAGGGSAVAGSHVPITIEVRGAGGRPLPGVTASFNVTSGNGQLNANSVSTDSNGRAGVDLTLDTRTGLNRVTVSAGGFSAPFEMTGTAGPAARLAMIATPASVTANAATALQITVQDAHGNTTTSTASPAVIRLESDSGGVFGPIAGPVAGFATATFKATTARAYRLTASSAGLTAATTDVSVTAGPVTTAALSVSQAVAPANFSRSARIRFTDDFANTVKTAQNTFSLLLPAGVSAAGPSTRSEGVVEQPLLATTVGAYTIDVTSPGLKTTGSVPFTVTAAPASRLKLNASSPVVQVRTTTTLTIAVSDDFGNVVSGAPASVTLSSNPPSSMFGAVTSSGGVATATFEPNENGSYLITAAAPGLASASLRMNATPPATTAYTISTIAGLATIKEGGNALEQLISGMSDVARDAGGNLYIVSGTRHKVFKVAPDGVITTFAGTGVPGSAGDGLPAAQAQLKAPRSVAVDAGGNVYIADTENYRIVKVGADGVLTTIAGSGFLNYLGDGGPAIVAAFGQINGITADAGGNLYLVDSTFSRIRKIDTTGTINTIAGTGSYGYSGDGGPATFASLALASAIHVGFDANGNLYIPDYFNYRVRRVSPDGTITTIAGTGMRGTGGNGGPATQAQLLAPSDVVVASDGSIYIASDEGCLWKILPDGTLHRVVESQLSGGMVQDGAGNFLLTAKGHSQVVRVATDGRLSRVAGLPRGFADGGGLASAAQLYSPNAIAVDAAGNVFVADELNNRIRKIDTAGNITTVAGNGQATEPVAGMRAIESGVGTPLSVAVSRSGIVYFIAIDRHRVWKIGADGLLSVAAGSAIPGFAGDGGPATSAQLRSPAALALDQDDNLYISDQGNYRIRRIAASDGVIRTVAGNGLAGSDGDLGLAIGAKVTPSDIAVDYSGNVYFIDSRNGAVLRRIGVNNIISTVPLSLRPRAVGAAGGFYTAAQMEIDRELPSGSIVKIAGLDPLIGGLSGDGGPARTAALFPNRVAVAPSGEVYVTDSVDDVIRKLTPVFSGALLSLSPAGLNFRGTQPASGFASIVFDGNAAATWTATATVSTAIKWLSTSQLNGTGNATLGVYVNPAGLPAGNYNGTVTVASPQALNGSVGIAVTLRVPGPTLTSIIPGFAGTGASVFVSIKGVDLVPGLTTLNISGTGVTASSVGVSVSDVSATFNIAANAARGKRSITVSTPHGTSGALEFNVLPTPSLSSVTPGFGFPGGSYPVTIKGKNFAAGATSLEVSGSGATLANVAVVDDTTITAVLQLSASAALGSRSIKATVDGLSTNAVSFLVVGPGFGTVPTQLQISSVAGGTRGYADGVGAAARFDFPEGIWGDANYLYVIDHYNFAIRKIERATGKVTTLAGSPTSNVFNFLGGPIWGDGTDLFVVQYGSIHRVNIATGAVTLIPYASRGFYIGALWGDNRGHLYITQANAVHRIDIATGNSVIIAGPAMPANAYAPIAGAADGIGSAARFSNPWGLWGDSEFLYISDTYNGTIRKLNLATREVTTIAGAALDQRVQDGVGRDARFAYPQSLWGDGAALYIGGGSQIRKLVLATGQVATVAGSPSSYGFQPGTGPDARFTASSLWSDGTQFYITDSNSNAVELGVWSKLPPAISSLTPPGAVPGQSVNVTIKGANFGGDAGITMTEMSGGTGITVSNVLVVDANTITATFANASNAAFGTRDITVATGFGRSYGPPFTVAIPPNQPALSSVDPAIGTRGTSVPVVLTGSNFVFGATGVSVSGSNVQVTAIAFNSSTSVTAFLRIDAAAALGTREVKVTVNGLVSNSRTFSVVPPEITGTPTQLQVTTFAGGWQSSVDGVGTAAGFWYPTGVWGDGTTLFVSDESAYTIRKISLATRQVTTIAGYSNVHGHYDSVGTDAEFEYPSGMWGDGTSLYVGDGGGVRKIKIDGAIVTSVAGYGTGFEDSGPAQFKMVKGVWGDGTNLYVTDNYAHTIRKIVIATGYTTTLAGLKDVPGNANGTGSNARFNWPCGLWGDGVNLYIADSENHTIRKLVIATGEVSTLASLAGVAGWADGTGSAARFNSPYGVWGDGTQLFVTDNGSHTVRRIHIATGRVTTVAGAPSIYGFTSGTGADALLREPRMIWGSGSKLYIAESWWNSDIRVATPSLVAPEITAITPPKGAAGASFNVTLSGANFVPGSTSVTMDGTSVGLSGVSVVNATTIRATITIPAGMPGGARNLTVVTPYGRSYSHPFSW